MAQSMLELLVDGLSGNFHRGFQVELSSLAGTL